MPDQQTRSTQPNARRPPAAAAGSAPGSKPAWALLDLQSPPVRVTVAQEAVIPGRLGLRKDVYVGVSACPGGGSRVPGGALWAVQPGRFT